MRFTSLLLAVGTLSWVVSCGGGSDNNKNPNAPQCSDGIDNDGDGLTDSAQDPGCDRHETEADD